jgi:hypothetical protein
MLGHDADLEFPSCCACCPHLRGVKASCTHDLRQSLVRELTTNRSCPVYSQEKTDAMRQLTGDQ